MNHIIAALFVIGVLFGVITATTETADLSMVQAEISALETMVANLPAVTEFEALDLAVADMRGPLNRLTARSMRLPRGISTGLDRMKARAGALARSLESEAFDQTRGSVLSVQEHWAAFEAAIGSSPDRANGEEIAISIRSVNEALPSLENVGIPASVEAGLGTLNGEIASLRNLSPPLPSSLAEELQAIAHALRPIARGLEEEYYTDPTKDETASTLISIPSALAGIRRGWGEVQANSAISQPQLLLTSLAVQARNMTEMLYGRAGLSVEIAISLIGIMALWLGIMRVAEEAGIIQALANMLRPVLRLLFPGIPKDHPANGALLMAMSANILGLDNAGTPLGIKAMQELQTLNTDKPTITTNQIMHLALSTSSLNLIPFSIIGYRIAKDSAMPNDIIVPVIIATSVSSAVAILMTYLLKGMSKDPAAVGEEAERITRDINAELHAALEGKNDKEGQS